VVTHDHWQLRFGASPLFMHSHLGLELGVLGKFLEFESVLVEVAAI
jgi:hypothetical protein